MTSDLETALVWTQRIFGLGLLVEGGEGWTTATAFGSRGVWGAELRQGKVGSRLGGWMAGVGAGGMRWVFVVRMLIGFGLWLPSAVVPDEAVMGMWAVLLATSMFLVVRAGGPLSGGSDSMMFQVQLGMLVASGRAWLPPLGTLGLAWIAAHSVLSYGLAGWAKLRSGEWLQGRAVQRLLRSEGAYAVWSPARDWARNRKTCAILGGAVVVFELVFPLVLVCPLDVKTGILLAGVGFHLGNAVVLGLNRFLWAWLATYPALLHFG